MGTLLINIIYYTPDFKLFPHLLWYVCDKIPKKDKYIASPVAPFLLLENEMGVSQQSNSQCNVFAYQAMSVALMA